ncbi:hypothetical protein TIFTF001_021990 [Ficus carica]|uniref:RNase H type-1 domain-containing protein n=1 Tax=Ficus carica TaxID=3494 RepID=A0AA88AT61_FICCA|nr:hypothetical protein TIFTF001_021990 [Ficus carica]
MASKTNLEIFCVVAWAIWIARNQWIHDGPKVSAMETLEKAGRFLDGTILGCQAKKIHGSFSPFMAECLALREEEEAVINDILELFSVSPEWSCSVICCEANRVAHCLAASVYSRK